MAIKPKWNDDQAQSLLGLVVLVGITYNLPSGPRLEQFYGTVSSIDKNHGITLELRGSRDGETFNLPPDLSCFSPAPLGDYRLKQTGEVVRDPDFICTWEHSKPHN